MIVESAIFEVLIMDDAVELPFSSATVGKVVLICLFELTEYMEVDVSDLRCD